MEQQQVGGEILKPCPLVLLLLVVGGVVIGVVVVTTSGFLEVTLVDVDAGRGAPEASPPPRQRACPHGFGGPE